MTLVLTRIMELIRSTLDPLFAGGCQRFKADGNTVSQVLPCAILRWVEDNTSQLEAAGAVPGGRRRKRLACVVELRLFHDDASAEDPNAFEWSDEAAEEQIGIADKAIANLANSTALRDQSTDADIVDIRWIMGGLQRGDEITKAGITFALLYQHQDLDPEAKA